MDSQGAAVQQPQQQQQLKLPGPGPSSTVPGPIGPATPAMAAKHSRDGTAAAAGTPPDSKRQRLSHCKPQQQPQEPAADPATSFADLQRAFPGTVGVKLLWSVALQVHGPNARPSEVQVALVLQLWGDTDTLQALRSSIAAADKTYCQHTLQVRTLRTAKDPMRHSQDWLQCVGAEEATGDAWHNRCFSQHLAFVRVV
jgi:hypothetical protein